MGGLDLIADFDTGQDRIDLSAFAGAGTLRFAGLGPSLEAGTVWYVPSGAGIVVSIELDGAAGAEFQFRLADASALTAADFLLG